MNRSFVIAVFVSLLAHAGVAASGAFFHKKPVTVAAGPEIPTIALDQPAPEPEESEPLAERSAELPAELADLTPPTQADLPSAVIDSPFVQKLQPAVATNLSRPGGVTIPANLRPGVMGGAGLGKIFDLSVLDQRPQLRGPISPSFPSTLKRSGRSGEVLVEFVVDAQGAVQDAHVVRSSHSEAEEAVIAAVQRARFTPGRKGGVAVSTRVQQPIAFNFES